jgi:hypothetical protein
MRVGKRKRGNVAHAFDVAGHMKKPVQTRLSEETYNEVMRRAKADKRTLSVFVELALEQYLREHPSPNLSIVEGKKS